MPHVIEPSLEAVSGHVPVLLQEVLASLRPAKGETVVDLTFGAGGYSRAILLAAPCRVIAFDRDPNVIASARAMIDQFEGRLDVIEAEFATFAQVLESRDIKSVDAVVMDIGVSSMQLDQAERGFSFMRDGPLDMRMSQAGQSAADIVASFSAEQLANIIYVFGDEPRSRAIGRAIVKSREAQPILTTRQLVAAIESAVGPHRPHMKTHPATKTFQALRIFVNDELGQLIDALIAAERVLKPGGRLVIVTFHSLEDRIVKQFLAERTGNLPSTSRHAPGPAAQHLPSFKLIHKGHIGPAEDELSQNPRSRSAKLRAAVRTDHAGWGTKGDYFKSVAAMRAA